MVCLGGCAYITLEQLSVSIGLTLHHQGIPRVKIDDLEGALPTWEKHPLPLSHCWVRQYIHISLTMSWVPDLPSNSISRFQQCPSSQRTSASPASTCADRGEGWKLTQMAQTHMMLVCVDIVACSCKAVSAKQRNCKKWHAPWSVHPNLTRLLACFQDLRSGQEFS